MAIKTKSADTQAINWLLVGGSLVTLFIWSNLADPFNAPKSWIMYITGFYLAGWAVFQIRSALNNSILRMVTALSGGYILTLFLAFLFTDEKFVGFFGENARRTGFLTYFCLTIFFLSSALLFRNSNIRKLDLVTLVVGPVVGIYGFFQHFKIDPIKWNNPYNSVLSTLGNPDFASAVMGIFLVLLTGIILNTTKALWIRIYALTSALLLIVTILFSQARQGLLAGFIGVAVVAYIFLTQRNKKLGLSFAGITAIGLVLGVFGMLNQGPLAKNLYKVSVTYRGDYWRAGINMFKHHMLFGVGLDRFGSYFRQYRDARQSLRRGPGIISNAAHNVPIQLAATGGILTLIVFIALFIFIFWRGIVALRTSSGVTQIVNASIVGAWVTYEAQSFISIDNVGIAIWGWILGGIVVGISILENNEPPTKNISTKSAKKLSQNRAKENLLQPLISGVAATAALALVIPLFLADSAARLSRAYAKPSSAQVEAYSNAVAKPLKFGFPDPHNKVMVGALLAQAGRIAQGNQLLHEVVQSDSRNYEALDVLSAICEQTNKLAQAIPFRKQMVALDPYNQKLLLKLGEDLKASGDLVGARAIIPLIGSFASGAPEFAQAKREFGA